MLYLSGFLLTIFTAIFRKITVILFLFLLTAANPAFSQDEVLPEGMELDDLIIEIKGNSEFKEENIESIIKTGTTDFFSYDDFAFDILRIEKFYFDNGYFDASVDTSTVYGKDKSITAKFTINENSPYIINEIRYTGIEITNPDIIRQVFDPEVTNIKKDEIYSKNSVNLEWNRILRILQNGGYAFAQAEPPEILRYATKSPELKNKVNIILNYNPGQYFRIGNTTLSARNNRYSYNYDALLKELEYSKGDVYNKQKIIDSETRLSRISIIENGRIYMDKIDTVNGIIDFSIGFSVREKYELQPELLGYDIDNQFFGGLGLSFSDKYFFGDGRTFTAKIRGLLNTFETYRGELTMEVFQPHIFNNNKITGNLNLSGVLYSIEDFRIEQIKTEAIINYELPRHTYINNLFFNWRISNDRYVFKFPIYYIENDTLKFLPEGAFANVFSSILGLTIVHNSTDNFQFPTGGYNQSLFIEESGLLSSLAKSIFNISTVNYIKFTLSNKFFFPVTKNRQASVLGKKFLIGTIFEYGDNNLKISGEDRDISASEVPLESRFIAGGSTSVRGWGSRKLGTFENKETGGNFILEGSFEHRIRPFLDNKGIWKDFGFVTFLDYGNLWERPEKFKVSDIALAIGGGLRYYTIVGPFRFDLGFKLYDYAPTPGTGKWLFENSISDIFKEKLTLQFGIGNTF